MQIEPILRLNNANRFFSVNRSIPVEITSMPDAVLNTPFGKLIEAQLSNFQINPN